MRLAVKVARIAGASRHSRLETEPSLDVEKQSFLFFGYSTMSISSCLSSGVVTLLPFLLLHIRSAHLRMARETRFSSGRYLLIQKYFCIVYDYVGKADLSKDC